MTLHLDTNRNKIICRWGEPTQIIMNKKPGIINRVKTLAVQTTKTGKLAKRDQDRYKGHPMYKYISLFRKKLLDIDYFPAEPGKFACKRCGVTHGVNAYYDIGSKMVVWLCGDHSHLHKPGEA